MTKLETVTIYLEQPLRQSAEAGQHNFINRMVNVLEKARFRLDFRDFPQDGVPVGTGLTLSHMKAPADAGGLVFRRVYHYPFWQIEKTAERWEWETARTRFDPNAIDPDEAEKFHRFWRRRLFGDLPEKATREGFYYVPLQGRLLQHRSFQDCSPVEMLEQTARNPAGKRVIAALHPKEVYTAAELSALQSLAARHSNLSFVTGEMERLLQRCDAVVTQNSAAAFNGYFFGKPALLYGKIDFHHIALNSGHSDDVFEALSAHHPDYSAYIYWFWQMQSINAGRPDAESRIAEQIRRCGWDL